MGFSAVVVINGWLFLEEAVLIWSYTQDLFHTPEYVKTDQSIQDDIDDEDEVDDNLIQDMIMHMIMCPPNL